MVLYSLIFVIILKCNKDIHKHKIMMKNQQAELDQAIEEFKREEEDFNREKMRFIVQQGTLYNNY